MQKKSLKMFVVVSLALTFIFASSACEKLKVSRLTANYHFTKGNQYFRDEQYRKAVEAYELAIASYPKLAEVYQFLGESYKNLYKPGDESPENLQRADKALEALTKSMEFFPTNKTIIASLADMYDRLGKFEDAEKLYLRILEMEPNNMNNYYVVAQFYRTYASGAEEEQKDELGNVIKTPFKKAEEMYLRRIELDPDNPEGYAYAAEFYDKVVPPLFDKANYFHKMQLKFDPNNVLIWYSIGVNRNWYAFRLQNVLSREEREQAALEGEKALLKAIELDPDFPESYTYLNILYRNVFVGLYPEKEERYIAEADKLQARADEVKKRALDRKRLEEELRGRR
jgi:Tfp pilus assembly protein PilF